MEFNEIIKREFNKFKKRVNLNRTRKMIDSGRLSDSEMVNLILELDDPKYTKYCVKNLEIKDSEMLAKLIESIDIKSIDDPEYIEYIKKIIESDRLESSDKISTIMYLDEPDYSKDCLKRRNELGLLRMNYSRKSFPVLTYLIMSINDPNYTKEWIERGVDPDSRIYNWDIDELIISLNDSDYTKEKIKRGVDPDLGIEEFDIAKLITSLNDPLYTLECVKRSEQLGIKDEVSRRAMFIDDPSFIKECIGLLKEHEELALDDPYLILILMQTVDKLEKDSDHQFLRDCIKDRDKLQITDHEIIINIIKLVNDPEFTMEILRECDDPELYKIYRQNIATIEEIYDNLDFYLDVEGRTEDKETILRMYQKNNDILKCKFEILDYIEYFGEDKINLMSCYEDITDQITGLSKAKLPMLANCISYYEQQYATEDWTPFARTILNNINNIDDDLLDQIIKQSDKNEINMENLIHLLINSNSLQITTLEELNNYEVIKQQKTDELIESSNISECKEALLEKAFNHGLGIAQDLVKKYGIDISKIEDEALKEYIIALTEIVNLDDINILKETYKSIEPSKIKVPNIFAVEKLLKREYARQYNQELFKVENAAKIEKLGENVYDAGTDFDMIITSIGAYHKGNPSENYNKDWNRPVLATQHFCCSYIRNDMMRTAPIPFVCFGFDNMSDDSLVAAGNADMASNNNGFVSYARRAERYYSSNNLINETVGHNEIDYYRIQEGKKKQPDYIVVFKTDGQIKPEHWQYAKQAQSDFGGKLPIVVVDVDRCIQSEKTKVDEMVATYKENPSKELLSQIKQKIKNNELTCTNSYFNYESDLHFCEDINVNELNELLQKTKEDSSVVSKMHIGSLDDIELVTKHVQGKSNFYNSFYKDNKISEQVTLSDIIDVAEEDKLGTLLDKASEVQAQNKSTSPVHGVQHIKNVLLLSNYIGKRDGLSQEYMSILQEAAIYHDVMHERAGDPNHAKQGANWYYNNVSKNKEVAFLIAAHESNGEDFEELISEIFKRGIKPEKKAQLIKCAQILQDADRLDVLRYNLENPEGQRFDANRLNNTQNASLIKAVIELNIRQALESGCLHIKNGMVCEKSHTAGRFVTDKDLQTCYRDTTPEEREAVARELTQRINQIDLVQDISGK